MQADSDARHLVDLVSALVDAAKKAGAEAADAVAVRGRSSSVSVRMGKVEATEASEGDDIALRVFLGKRAASVSGNAASDPRALAERAVAMARVSPEDPHQGLADAARLVREPKELELLDQTELGADELREAALAMEEMALSVPGVTNSGGSSASSGLGGLVLATSEGFVGQYAGSRFSRGISVVAGEGTAMERDYDFSSQSHFADLRSAEEIGRKAAERAVRRLGARKARTGPVTVVLDPRVARGFAGHFASAINGASVARKTSFLREMMGKQVASAAVTVTDNPLKVRGQASRPFDGEGVEGQPLTVIESGVLQHWLLSTSAASELGLETNGRGMRSGTSVNPGSTNFAIEPGSVAPEALMKDLKEGFYVTEVFGHGVNMVTGDYSRGASGFWIENGELTYPVSEVTIAGNLKDMFLHATPANDLDRNFGTAAPTIVIEGMTLAGA
ncbi:MAG: TldD/PmbA family protein [Rhizobiaceae bacterium]|nr:TldD/PmbA family protein [Rhizobiaceae bacterium]